MLSRRLTTTALRAFLARPLVTSKIGAATHREALRLRLKGARPAPRPHAAAANAANTGLANDKHHDYTGAALSAVEREPGSREALWSGAAGSEEIGPRETRTESRVS